MKDDHLTLRLPRALARALARWARDRRVPKSQVAREAVAAYLAGAPAQGSPARVVTASDLAGRWAALPRLGPEEAAAFARELEAASQALPPLSAPWG